MRIKKITLFLGVAFYCTQFFAAATDFIPITILHTNDTHGHYWSSKESGREMGGFAAQAALIQKIRNEVAKKGGITLLLHGGDINTGVPYSDLLDAEPDFIAMQTIGYDAAVVGNHDLDGGLKKLNKQLGWKKFPLLCANIHYTDGSPLTEPFLLLERKGVKIGILGLMTQDLPSLVYAKHLADLHVENPLLVAKKMAPILKQKGAELLILLNHIGILDSKATHLPADYADDRKIAESIKDYPVIVGGHSHTLLPQGVKVNESIIVQAGSHNTHLGRLDFLWNKKLKKMSEVKAQVIPIDPTQGEDLALKQKLAPYREKAGTFLEKVIGEAESSFGGKRHAIRHKESHLGNFICDVIKNHTQSDVVIYNSGGIRDSLEAGPIQLKDIYQILPFDNTVQVAQVTGKQIWEALQSGIKNQYRTGSFPQVAGLKFEYQESELKKVWVGEKPLSLQKTYQLATNNFVMAGGDYYEVFKGLPSTLSEKKVRDLVIETIEKQKKISAPPMGRALEAKKS